MAQPQSRSTREGLSLQTLVIAAVASGFAAIVVSHIWTSGTVVAAAMTPVIVSVVKEALHRPLQSQVVRRTATSARQVVAGSAAARMESAQRRSPAVGTIPTPPPPRSNGSNGANGELTQGDVLLTHPRRVYGSSGPRRSGGFPLRGRPLKLAIVTGLLAFVVAAVVLTVPELVFGGSVGGGGSTTIFGGSGKASSNKSSDQQNTTTDQQQAPQGGQTTPQTTPAQPQQSPQPQAQPQQPPSSGGGAAPAPAPSSPAPSAPSTPSP